MSGRAVVERWAAFTTDPAGGNPAGVVLDARGLRDAEMQEIAAEVGYAETAFVVGPDLDGDGRRHRLRYFSPTAEVPFCGHATVATAVALAARADGAQHARSAADGAGGARGADPRPGRETATIVVETPVGPVPLTTAVDAAGIATASFTSVEPHTEPLAEGVLLRLLRLLGIDEDDLDPRHPVRAAFAGNLHPVVPLAERATFDSFAVDPAAVRRLMDEQGWAGTVTVLHVGETDDEGVLVVEARNLFPVGAITEDPATGSAAAAVGAWLRDSGSFAVPGRVRVLQGRHVGRPGVLDVRVPETGGIVVSGSAVRLDRR